MNKGFVYVLLLQENYIYVGFTRKLAQRIDQHCRGAGAKFTAVYKPIKVLSVEPGDENLELATTVLYMNNYGWKYVRGSKWCAVEMSEPPNFSTC